MEAGASESDPLVLYTSKRYPERVGEESTSRDGRTSGDPDEAPHQRRSRPEKQGEGSRQGDRRVRQGT